MDTSLLDSILESAEVKQGLTYDDITLVPREISTLKSRAEAIPNIKVFGIELKLPLIAAPMPDVCNGSMAARLGELGALGIIHRFQPIEQQVLEYKKCSNTAAACAIGITGDYVNRFHELYKAGCTIFCIDTANGANKKVEEALKNILSISSKKLYIIAGNIASKEGYEYLENLKVDAVRIGIAGGSVCTTKTETGVYVPMVSCLEEIIEFRMVNARTAVQGTLGSPANFDSEIIKQQLSLALQTKPMLIADGGIRMPADMCKALGMGADLVMAGGIFAGTDESPGSVVIHEKQRLKRYRGAASFGVQYEHTNVEPDYSEGDETFVPYKGSVDKIVKRFDAGLRSSMSYMNARTLDEYRWNISIMDL